MNFKSANIYEVPEALRSEINKYLDSFSESKLLVIDASETTPYKDKVIRELVYKAYLQHGNVFTDIEFSW